MKPLVPDDADLRGMPWMKLDTSRLLDSDFFAMTTGSEFKAAMSLWCKSWTQTPAGSLPNDDRILAHMCCLTKTQWQRVKTRALHGWFECDDGRLYHPVISEQANAAWEERKKYQEKQEANSGRKQRERNIRQSLFTQLREAGYTLKWDTPTAELKALVERMEQQEAESAETVMGVSPTCPAPVTEQSQPGHTPVTSPVTSPVTDQSHSSHTAVTG